MVEPESSDRLSLTAVPYLGEIPYIENLETKRSSLADIFEGRLDIEPLDAVLPSGWIWNTI